MFFEGGNSFGLLLWLGGMRQFELEVGPSLDLNEVFEKASLTKNLSARSFILTIFMVDLNIGDFILPQNRFKGCIEILILRPPPHHMTLFSLFHTKLRVVAKC